MKFIAECRMGQKSRSPRQRAATIAAVALGLSLAAQSAWAQAYGQDTEGASAQQSQHKQGAGIAVSVAGGVSSFSHSNARDFIDTGGTWDVRGVFGTRTLAGVEAAYVGAAYGLNALGESSTLFGNGLELSGRLNILRNGLASVGGLQPYVLGGVAWTHYSLSHNFTTASIDNSDNTFDIPVGAGLGYYFKHVLLDARFAYRFSFSDTLIQDSSLDNMALTARVGAEF